MPNPAAPEGAPDVAARLPIAARVAALASGPHEVAWAFAALEAGIADAVAHTFGVHVRFSGTAPSPLAHPAFAALYAAARTEQVIRELSARTNLLLAGTTAVVAGDGPLAARLTTALGRIGVRVRRDTADPLAALTARLAGLSILATPAPPAHYTFLTGEHDRAQDRGSSPTRRTGPHADGVSTSISGPLRSAGAPVHAARVVIDVSPTGSEWPVSPGAVPATRANVRIDGATRVLTIDGPLPRDASTPEALPWRITDALVALSILVAGRGDPHDIDDALARAALGELDARGASA